MSCIICLNPIVNKYTLDCNHSFCFKCITKWLETPRFRYGQMIGYNNCPICRTSSQIDTTKIRLTRSLTVDKRRTNISNELFNLCEKALAEGVDGAIDSITKILTIIEANPWYLKHYSNLTGECSCGLAIQIKKKLNDFEKEGWKEAAIWKYKLRNIL